MAFLKRPAEAPRPFVEFPDDIVCHRLAWFEEVPRARFSAFMSGSQLRLTDIIYERAIEYTTVNDLLRDVHSRVSDAMRLYGTQHGEPYSGSLQVAADALETFLSDNPDSEVFPTTEEAICTKRCLKAALGVPYTASERAKLFRLAEFIKYARGLVLLALRSQWVGTVPTKLGILTALKFGSLLATHMFETAHREQVYADFRGLVSFARGGLPIVMSILNELVVLKYSHAEIADITIAPASTVWAPGAGTACMNFAISYEAMRHPNLTQARRTSVAQIAYRMCSIAAQPFHVCGTADMFE